MFPDSIKINAINNLINTFSGTKNWHQKLNDDTFCPSLQQGGPLRVRSEAGGLALVQNAFTVGFSPSKAKG